MPEYLVNWTAAMSKTSRSWLRSFHVSLGVERFCGWSRVRDTAAVRAPNEDSKEKSCKNSSALVSWW